MDQKTPWYTYILRCRDNTLYTGMTNDLEKRLAAHNDGSGAKYTRARLPVDLVYYETMQSRSAAASREFKIKKMPRKKKQAMIASWKRPDRQ